MDEETSGLAKGINLMNALCSVDREFRRRGGKTPEPLHLLSKKEANLAVVAVADILIQLEQLLEW